MIKNKLFKKIRTRTWIALGVIIILSPALLISLNPKSASAEWMDERWAFRKRIEINKSATAETNVYIAFDSADVLNTSGSNFQSDCDDIRFTKANGQLLPHIVNSGCNTASTDIDVLLDSFPVGDYVIYMYYGNPSAANAESSFAFTTEATSYTIGTPGSEEEGPGPIAYWSFDEGVANTCSGGSNDACDSTDQINDGAFGASTAAPTIQTDDLCVMGKCLLFDGSNDTVTVSNTISGVQSVAFWVKVMSTSSTEQILDLNGTDTLSSVSGTVTAGGFGTETIYVDGVSGATTLTANKWHHVEVTTGSSLSASAITIGNISTNFGNFFIDDLKLYNYARSAAEVKADFKGASTSVGTKQKYLSDGLLGYWRLDESSGNASDSSGNALTLTNNGTTTYVNARFGRGSNHVPASTQYLSTATTINGVKSVSFWTYPDSNTNYYISLTSSEYITSTSGTLSATGFSNPTIYVNGKQGTTITASTWNFVTVTTDTAINADTFYIGRQGSNYFDGVIDSVRLHSRTLSSAEANNLASWAAGPVGYWNFDENTGTSTAYDRSTNGFNGTLNSITAQSWVPGVAGASLDFDGSSDFITLSALGISGNQGRSVSFWTNLDSNKSTMQTWTFWGAATGNQLFSINFDVNTDDIYVAFSNNDYHTGNNIMTRNAWHHVEVTFDGGAPSTSTVHVYLDGIPQSLSKVGAGGGDANTSDTNYSIAQDTLNAGRTVSGMMDDVRIYNYARTPGQVIEDMNAGSPQKMPNPIGYWQFDEANGQTLNDSGWGGNNARRGDTTGSEATDPSWVTDSTSCRSGACLDFASDHAEVSDTSELEGFSQMTVTAWVYADSCAGAGVNDIVNKEANSYLLRVNACKLDGGVYTSAWVTLAENFTFPTGSWQHVAMVYNGKNVKMFRNGKYISDYTNTNGSSDAQTGTVGTNANDLRIGNDAAGNSRFWDGKIDEVKIYNTGLTDEQVRLDYNEGAVNFGVGTNEAEKDLSAAPSGLVGYWPLDENTGTSTTVDKGSGGANGTLTSITHQSWVPGKYGSALDLDGSADYVDIGTGPSSVKTVSFWVYPETTTEYFVNLTSTTDYIAASSGTLTPTGFTSPTVYVNGVNQGATGTITAGSWQHVVVTSATAENASNLDIGRTQDTNYLEGKIDDIKLYSSELSRDQVAYDYNRGRPIGWWEFDECEGTTTYDASGKSKNGTWSGATGGNTAVGTCGSGTGTEAWNNGTTGKRNASLEFDDTDDIVTVTDNNIFDLDGEAISISAWVNTDANEADNVVLSKGASYEMGVDGSGNVYWDGVGAQADDGSGLVSSGAWHHVVVTNDDSTVTYYVDGKQTGTDSAGIDTDNATNIIIGGDGTNFFDGKIDDVRIYNYVLTTAQIRKILNDGSAVRFGPDSGSP